MDLLHESNQDTDDETHEEEAIDVYHSDGYLRWARIEYDFEQRYLALSKYMDWNITYLIF